MSYPFIKQTAVATPDRIVVSPWYEDQPGPTARDPHLSARTQAVEFRTINHPFAGYILLAREVMVTLPAEEVV